MGILNVGVANGLIDNDCHDWWTDCIRDGEFNIFVFFPVLELDPGSLPTSSISILPRSGKPMGFAHALDKNRAKARQGSMFFYIRAAKAAFVAGKGTGVLVRINNIPRILACAKAAHQLVFDC